MNIAFVRLTEIPRQDLMDLMNLEKVREQMPLFDGEFDLSQYDAFINAKEQIWEEHGFGPFGFIIDDSFAGWGGLQPENGDVDLALVLHPDFWGYGNILYKQIISKAFNERGIPSITVLLPTTRKHIQALYRNGFMEDGEVMIGDELFKRFRIQNPLASA